MSSIKLEYGSYVHIRVTVNAFDIARMSSTCVREVIIARTSLTCVSKVIIVRMSPFTGGNEMIIARTSLTMSGR